MTLTGVVDLGIEPEVKEILDNHGNRITQLEISTGKMEERFSRIDYQLLDMKTDVGDLRKELKNGLAKIENTMLSNFNSLLTFKTNEDNNKTKLYLKILGIVGSVITLLLIGYFTGKGISIPDISTF